MLTENTSTSNSRGRRWELVWACEALGGDVPSLRWEADFLLRLLSGAVVKVGV